MLASEAIPTARTIRSTYSVLPIRHLLQTAGVLETILPCVSTGVIRSEGNIPLGHHALPSTICGNGSFKMLHLLSLCLTRSMVQKCPWQSQTGCLMYILEVSEAEQTHTEVSLTRSNWQMFVYAIWKLTFKKYISMKHLSTFSMATLMGSNSKVYQ